ncbi:MAG: ABC transporter ATP-binding protein [Candidatus Omnitrophica bacterium]|nr:ABC transporter ATP-binding protein [Candidatus Omnitrophota bacterium]
MLLEVRGLKIYFKDDNGVTKAIDGIDFAIGENEVVGLVGESGSGKTMTALSMMRLIPQGGHIENGEILFEDKDILKFSKREMLKIRGRNISMIFQEPFTALNPVLRVGEQIDEILILHKSLSRKEARRETMDLLKKVRIENPERIYFGYPHQLSGGQRQRAMIAMALALRPKIVIADEPTTALDVTIQSEILKLLLSLREEFRMSILFITHDLGVINEVADRILVMKEGKIVEEGRKADILGAPKHPYTKRLLDAVPKIEREKEISPVKEPPVFVEIRGISKTFPIERGAWRIKIGSIKAVEGVSLKLKEGRTLGLVGESASGKTTLGRLILNLIEPDSGDVIIKGRDIKEFFKKRPKEIRQMMQIVFQDPFDSLDPRLKMREIVLEGPNILGLKRGRKEELLKDVLRNVSLDYKDRSKYPHQFSGGQRQRIAIARALAVEPKFLVLDEPVSSLDVSIQAGILSLLKDIQKRLRLTYLFISHDLRVVGSMADEVAVMHKGKIVEVAPKSVIYTRPGHPYTKKLLASIPSL